MPDCAAALFRAAPASLLQIYLSDGLAYSCREPSVNVYTLTGEFSPHKDQQALTILLPLSSPELDFEGGGTAFWAQDSRGHRVAPPSLVLRPPAGTALLFGGQVTHAGLPVEWGVRACFVRQLSPLRAGFGRGHERL
eukprot:2712039-Prymnesium_polylepis.1